MPTTDIYFSFDIYTLFISNQIIEIKDFFSSYIRNSLYLKLIERIANYFITAGGPVFHKFDTSF